MSSQWQDSTKRVSDRKSQLESMFNECIKLNEVNDEFMTKIIEMEQKVECLPELAFGKDTLKKQKTDFKVILN